ETAPFVVRKRFPAELHPNGRSFVYVDQYDGEVLLVENALRSPLGTRLVNLFYPIHIGLWGGLPTRILQVLIGLTPAVLFITGLLMWRN
ncbi:PepSY-associated TM helix domain-containing protein, partial [Acinetobacter baumannii]